MITVYLVDGNTRIYLPGTPWAYSALEKLRDMGHTVQATGQESIPDLRDNDEVDRAMALLTETGI